jgi:hypothetical protein
MSSDDEASVESSNTPTKRKTKQRKGTWGKDKAIGKTVRKIFKKWVDSYREKGINPWDYTLQNFADRYPKLNLPDDAWYAQSSGCEGWCESNCQGSETGGQKSAGVQLDNLQH